MSASGWSSSCAWWCIAGSTTTKDGSVPVAAHLRAGYDRVVADTVAALSEETFAVAYQAGRNVPYDLGLAEARDLAAELKGEHRQANR